MIQYHQPGSANGTFTDFFGFILRNLEGLWTNLLFTTNKAYQSDYLLPVWLVAAARGFILVWGMNLSTLDCHMATPVCRRFEWKSWQNQLVKWKPTVHREKPGSHSLASCISSSSFSKWKLIGYGILRPFKFPFFGRLARGMAKIWRNWILKHIAHE